MRVLLPLLASLALAGCIGEDPATPAATRPPTLLAEAPPIEAEPAPLHAPGNSTYNALGACVQPGGCHGRVRWSYGTLDVPNGTREGGVLDVVLTTDPPNVKVKVTLFEGPPEERGKAVASAEAVGVAQLTLPALAPGAYHVAVFPTTGVGSLDVAAEWVAHARWA